MIVKYSQGFETTSILCLAGWVLLIPQIICSTTTCRPPDFPVGGSYEPKREEYDVGQTVTFVCYLRFRMYDENLSSLKDRDVTCQSNGKWSEETPFCDTPTKFIKMLTDSKALKSAMLDGDSETCSPTRNNTEEILQFSLDRASVLYAAVVCWKKGNKMINVTFSSDFVTVSADSDSCILISPSKEFANVKTEIISLQISSKTNSSIFLCEIQVFTKSDKWCLHPPENSIPNGQLEVSRNQAALHCGKGFREKEGRQAYAICENNTWSYQDLQCVEGEPQKDHNILACPPPDFPEGGRYEPLQAEYDVGQAVTYYCNNMRPMFDENLVFLYEDRVVTCQSNGKWSEGTPFCDTPTELKNPITSSKELESTVQDHNVLTCFPTLNDTEEILRFSLNPGAAVYFAMLCWRESNARSFA
ncbi:unnamed protein product [Larinioides sclopetarius]|uniref:Sushi domain-containing protein n=1 Tax=Larinioides sclopetarius TaxID=280406 RepID=A0AAV2B0R8_9ARAC